MDKKIEQSDQELVQNYLKGDKEALKTLISRYLKPVYNFVYRLCGNADEAHDIAQETFVKIWKNLKKYDSKKKFSTWMFSIARNTAIDWLRKKRPSLFSSFDDEETKEEFEKGIADTELLQHELFEREETKSVIEDVLKPLPLNYKSIILLHINNEMTFEEIATVVKKPMNTVKSQYRRALLMMKKDLQTRQENKKPQNPKEAHPKARK